MSEKKIIVEATLEELETVMLLESLYRELSYIKYEKLRLDNLLHLKLEVQERLRKIYGVERK